MAMATEPHLLERASFLAELDRQLSESRRAGRLVLLGGDAGVGKTALLRRFSLMHPETHALWGSCDPLFTPRPFGPVLDFAERTGGPLAEALSQGARPHDVVVLLLRLLRSSSPSITIFEDIHWADEATLDVLRLVARRVESVPALFVATYRDEEIDRHHPLRIVLGDLGTLPAVEKLRLPPLSPAAVEELARPHGIDADELYRKTGGNPFYVTEVLAAGSAGVPSTVRDAVSARIARLHPQAQKLLEYVAIVPSRVELLALKALAGETFAGLDECLSVGALQMEGEAVAFRHEIARLAVEETIPSHRVAELHRAALAVFSRLPAADPARLAHHAELAGDADAVLRHARAAGDRAALSHAHREAAAQYGRALKFAEGLPPEQRAELYERRAHECYLTDQLNEAIDAIQRAIACHRQLNDRRGEGDAVRALSEILWCPGRITEAEQTGKDAVELLEQLQPGHELGMAYARLAQIYVSAGNVRDTIAWGTRALALAEHLNDTEILVYALDAVGSMEYVLGVPQGREKIERSLELARRAGLDDYAGRAYVSLAIASVLRRSYADAHRYIGAGLDYCTERDLDIWRFYLLAARAQLELAQGRWTEAVESASLVIRDRCISILPRTRALVVLGLVRARRGDPEVWTPLDEAAALAEPTGDPYRIALVAAARAEAAWLEGRQSTVAEATDVVLASAVRRGDSQMIGQLASWRRRAGIREPIPSGAAPPYDSELSGDWKRAAELWRDIDCPYEAAIALGDADDEAALRRSLEELQRLGAQAAAAIVARRLRGMGARDIPRGPRPSTLTHPAGLTSREMEILALMAQGLRNSEMARHLHLSSKTIDHHVSSVLGKLGVRSRTEAVAEAARRGFLADTPPVPTKH